MIFDVIHAGGFVNYLCIKMLKPIVAYSKMLLMIGLHSNYNFQFTQIIFSATEEVEQKKWKLYNVFDFLPFMYLSYIKYTCVISVQIFTAICIIAGIVINATVKL